MNPPDKNEQNTPDTTGTIIADFQLRPDLQIAPQDAAYIQVEVVGGPMDGTKTNVAGSSFQIGRGKVNDLSLHLDPLVSMKHARITKEGQHYWLEDLDSSNGTFLGDEQIRGRTLIGPGTLFVLGQTCLEFLPR